jgi:hypothetical protein
MKERSGEGFTSKRLFRGFSKEILPGILVLFIFIACACALSRFWNVFEYDTDEGMNLMRALLHNNGFILYKDIWMDCPPLLVSLLSGLFRCFGAFVFPARFLILLFSAFLLLGVFTIVRRSQNLVSALSAIVLIAVSAHYLKLSVSVMAGLPALALAVWSVYPLLLYERSRRKAYLCISGLLLALALQTKFLAIIFLPAIIFQIMVIEKSSGAEGRVRRCLSSVGLWLLSAIGVYSYISFVAVRIDFSQMAGLYIPAMKLPVKAGYLYVLDWIAKDPGIFLLAAGASFFLLKNERKFFFVPFISLACGLLVLSGHNPIWYHHRLFIAVPACWLASFGIYKLCDMRLWQSLIRGAGFPRWRGMFVAFLLGFAFIITAAGLPAKYAALKKEVRRPFSAGQRNALVFLERHKGSSRFMVTDRPIFAFYSGLLVPPDLVTSSYKRIATGSLTAERFTQDIEQARPDLLLFARFPGLRDKVINSVREGYTLGYKDDRDSIRIYVRNPEYMPSGE